MFLNVHKWYWKTNVKPLENHKKLLNNHEKPLKSYRKPKFSKFFLTWVFPTMVVYPSRVKKAPADSKTPSRIANKWLFKSICQTSGEHCSRTWYTLPEMNVWLYVHICTSHWHFTHLVSHNIERKHNTVEYLCSYYILHLVVHRIIIVLHILTNFLADI